MLLDSMITEDIAKKGKRDACEAVEAGVKVLYFKAKNDWAKIVGNKQRFVTANAAGTKSQGRK